MSKNYSHRRCDDRTRERVKTYEKNSKRGGANRRKMETKKEKDFDSGQ